MKELGDILVDKISKDCLISLQAVKGIMHTYRVTNKEPSTNPSFYVQNIFTNLSKFLNSETVSALPTTTKSQWSLDVMKVVTNKYVTLAYTSIMYI